MYMYCLLHVFILLSLYYFKKKHIDTITNKVDVNTSSLKDTTSAKATKTSIKIQSKNNTSIIDLYMRQSIVLYIFGSNTYILMKIA